MKTTKLFFLVVNFILMANVYQLKASVVRNSDCGPVPFNAMLADAQMEIELPPGHYAYQQAKQISVASNCFNPPPSVPNASVFQNFNCTFTCLGNFTNAPALVFTAPCSATAIQVYQSTSGNTRHFDTEMLQMNIQEGNLPPGVMFRESPTLASTGQTTITDLGGGQYQIDSFFDIFIEVSFDSGLTWAPDINGPGHWVLQDVSSIPVLNNWALAALGVLVIGLGAFFVKRII